MAAAKRRGVKLGGDRGARLTAKARAAGRAAVQKRAQAAGCESLRAIAAGLEERGISCGTRREVVSGSGGPIVGGGWQPFLGRSAMAA